MSEITVLGLSGRLYMSLLALLGSPGNAVLNGL